MKIITDNGLAEKLDPLDDFVFFKVMGEKGDEVQLIGFLNAVLGRSGNKRIDYVEIMENKSFIRDIKSGKSCTLDVLAVLQDKTKVNIEVQLEDKYNIDRRSLYYISKICAESLKRGWDYRQLPDIVSIIIVNFDFPKSGTVHTCFHLREDTNPALILTPALEIHYVNMVEWRRQRRKRQQPDVENAQLQQWLTFFDEKSPPEQVEEVVKMNMAIRAADERYRYITQDEEAREVYRRRQKAKMDMLYQLNIAREEGEEKGLAAGEAKGLAAGKAEGQTEKSLEIARKMKELKLPIAQISGITGLSSETIEKL